MESLNATTIDSTTTVTQSQSPTAKPFWQSTGFWGIVLSLFVALNNPINQMLEKDTISKQDIWYLIQVLASSGLAFFGRATATQPLTMNPRRRPTGSPSTTTVTETESTAVAVSVNKGSEETYPGLTDGF